jgi:hypothetical protein
VDHNSLKVLPRKFTPNVYVMIIDTFDRAASNTLSPVVCIETEKKKGQ